MPRRCLLASPTAIWIDLLLFPYYLFLFLFIKFVTSRHDMKRNPTFAGKGKWVFSLVSTHHIRIYIRIMDNRGGGRGQRRNDESKVTLYSSQYAFHLLSFGLTYFYSFFLGHTHHKKVFFFERRHRPSFPESCLLFNYDFISSDKTRDEKKSGMLNAE